jgi:hypothetical protein
MRIVPTLIAAGVAMAALTGVAVAAEQARMKTLTVALPDGSIEHIRYAGDTPPRVMFVARPAPADLLDAAFGPESPFAGLERISAAMDRQMAAMLQQAQAMRQSAMDGNAPTMAGFTGLPAGTVHYSFVSTTSGSGTCTQSIRISAQGTGQQPRVIRTSSGDCGSAGAAPVPAPATAPAPPRPPAPVTPVDYERPQPKKPTYLSL